MGGSTPKNVLGAICFACIRQCRLSSAAGKRSFPVQFASASGANRCPARNEPWDSLAGLGPEERRYGRCPNVVLPYIWAKHLQVWRESPVEQSTRKESGWAVGWVA